MSTHLIQSETLTNIANAIRAKDGSSGTMTPTQMPTKIANIPSGGGTPTISAFSTSYSSDLIPSDEHENVSITIPSNMRSKNFIGGGIYGFSLSNRSRSVLDFTIEGFSRVGDSINFMITNANSYDMIDVTLSFMFYFWE